jgi:hypothetical protein
MEEKQLPDRHLRPGCMFLYAKGVCGLVRGGCPSGVWVCG